MPSSYESFDAFMRRLPDCVQVGVALAMIAGLTAFKLTAGESVTLIDFLFIAVVGIGWFVHRRWCGYLVAVIAAADSVVIAVIAAPYASPGAAAASGAARLALYLIVLALIGMMRRERAGHQKDAVTDPQTGAMNARAFRLRALDEVERSQRYGHELSLAFLDIDDFKQVNDRLGHAAGDRALLDVCHVLRSTVRSVDTVARVGGDEFAVLMPETRSADARAVIDRVRYEVGRLALADGGGVPVSIGLVTFNRPPGSIAELTGAADALMYRAKNAGKDGVEQAERAGSYRPGARPNSSGGPSARHPAPQISQSHSAW